MAFNKNFRGGAREFGRPRNDRGGFGGGRGGFGGNRGGDDRGPREMFTATCANCNKPCEVPFKPNGTKPVYCKDCFGTMQGDDRGAPRGGFGERESRAERPQRGEGVVHAHSKELAEKVDALTKKVDGLVISLDYAIKLFKGEGAGSAKPVVEQTKEKAKAPKAVPSKNKSVVDKPSKATRLAKKTTTKAKKK